MSTFFTSDQHIGHENIVHNLGEGRPFQSLNHMHSVSRNNWFQTVKPEDTVYVLGDAALGNLEQSILFFSDLPGHKKFMPGNHDKIGRTNSAARNSKFRPLYESVGFEILAENITITVDTSYGPQPVILSHYPYGESYVRDNSEQRKDKFLKVRPVNEGLPLIHGHTHSRKRFDEKEPLQFHVGVDANDFTPVDLTEIIDWLETLHTKELI